MRIFITRLGFIEKAGLKALIIKNKEVVILDNLNNSNKGSLTEFENN